MSGSFQKPTHSAPHDHSGHRHGPDHRCRDHEVAEGPSGEVTDPVCGMTVDADITEYRAKADGKAYFFCSQGCLEKFQADPSQSVFGPL